MNEDRMILISTHQIRDLDNMIDGVIIVENGELLVNASLEDIGEKMSFKNVDVLPEGTVVLYEEDSLKGKSIVIKNTGRESTKVNLEHLFNAVSENPSITKEIFNN